METDCQSATITAWGLNPRSNLIGCQFVYYRVELYMIRPPTSCSASLGVAMIDVTLSVTEWNHQLYSYAI